MRQKPIYRVGTPVVIQPCWQTSGKEEYGVITKSEFKTARNTTMVLVSGFPRAVPAFKVNFL